MPDSLRGVLHQIKVELVESYFESLPGVRDPTKTGFHNYKLQIPNIVFGIPLSGVWPSLLLRSLYYLHTIRSMSC